MSKSKNKGKKPQQNDIKNDKETKEKEVELIEETSEEAEEIVTSDEEAAEEVSEETSETVEEDEEVKEEKADKTEKTSDNEGSFIDKCKKDPVIPVCLLLAFLAIIVAGIYFVLPNAVTPTMGMTLQEFQTRFNNGEVNKSLINSGVDIGFRTPAFVDINKKPSILGEKEVISGNGMFVDYFSGPFKYNYDGGVEGATRKSDDALSYVRVYVLYNENQFNTVWLYSSNAISALYPELTMYQAMDIGMKAMNEFNGDVRYYVKGNYGFRLVAVKKTGDGGIIYPYIVIDIVPRNALSASQIREDLDIAATEPTVSVAETTATT